MKLSSANINVMVKACRKAAKNIIRDFGEIEKLQVSLKGPGDFVTASDKKAEKILIEELQKARPRFSILSEEIGQITNDEEFKWIIDPIDGTTNFLHGIPHFAISIGLEQKGKIICGIIYDPIKDELFWSEKGMGAFLNNNVRLRVSGRKELNQALMSTGIPWKGMETKHQGFMKILKNAMENCSGIRRYGAAALDLAYVASGRYDAFWEFGLKIWDIASGSLLVKESGGFVGELNNKDNFLYTGDIFACNNNLIDEFKQKVLSI